MNGIQNTSHAQATSSDQQSTEALQSKLLDGVSRTFALTIPQLPKDLYPVVANAYLLCRIVDTIEDEISLSPDQKRHFCTAFVEVVKYGADATQFSQSLLPLLSEQTIPSEHELIKQIPQVIDITRGFSDTQISALSGCVETMANGMPQFQAQGLDKGLPTMDEMDRYCYYVAGCVGEMLAKLFCEYSTEIAPNEAVLLNLSVSFGQGLQMTNILKDIWDDLSRGVCWLPQDIFDEYGYDLAKLSPGQNSDAFKAGLEHLIEIAHFHLADALSFTLLIPKHETGIRNFCLWALGMALLTLRKIKDNLNFDNSNQVKISRHSVKATVLCSRLCGSHDSLLRLLFNWCGRGLSISQSHKISKMQHNKLVSEIHHSKG